MPQSDSNRRWETLSVTVLDPCRLVFLELLLRNFAYVLPARLGLLAERGAFRCLIVAGFVPEQEVGIVGWSGSSLVKSHYFGTDFVVRFGCIDLAAGIVLVVFLCMGYPDWWPSAMDWYPLDSFCCCVAVRFLYYSGWEWMPIVELVQCDRLQVELSLRVGGRLGSIAVRLCLELDVLFFGQL